METSMTSAESRFEAMSALGIDAYVPLGREGKAHGAVNGKRSSEMAKKLKTKLGRARYKARKSIVEPVFGWVKRVLGFRSFSLRSLKKVQG